MKRGIAGGPTVSMCPTSGYPGRKMCFDGMLLFTSNLKRKFGTFTKLNISLILRLDLFYP